MRLATTQCLTQFAYNALHLPETKQENKQTNETNLETNKQTNKKNCTGAVDQICIKGTYLPRAWVSGCFPSSLCPAAGKSLNIDKAWQWDCSVSDCIRLLCIRQYQAAPYQTVSGCSVSVQPSKLWKEPVEVNLVLIQSPALEVLRNTTVGLDFNITIEIQDT